MNSGANREDLLVSEAGRGARLDRWLAAQFPQFSRARLQEWIEAGLVLVNGDPVVRAGRHTGARPGRVLLRA